LHKANSDKKTKLPIANCQLPLVPCFLLIVNCLLLIVFPATAQHTIMRSFNINDGLVSNQVRGFYQDKKGFIWIMTWEGLSRHDGNSFRNYTVAEGLAHPLINAMIEDADGRIFVAENDGTIDVILDGEVLEELRTKYGKPINTFMPEPSGRILAPSDSTGIGVFHEGTFSTLNKYPFSPISVTEVLSEGDYFIFCGNKSGVMQYDHTIIKLWPDTIEYNCIIKDNLNRILVGTSKGLRIVNPFPGILPRYELISTEYDHTPWSRWTIHEILQTSDHSIWLATIGGLIQIKQDHSWRLYNRNDGLPTDYITSLFEDKTGFLWIGTDQGIAKLDIKNTIDLFTIGEELPNNAVSDILPATDGSALVISIHSSVLRIKPNQPLQSLDLSSLGRIHDFLIVGNDTLVTTDKGRYRLNDHETRLWTAIPYSLAETSLVMVNGCIFSTVTNKININCPTESYTDSTLDDQIGAIASGRDGEVWVSTANKGVYQVKVKRSADGKMELEWNDFNAYLPEKTIRSLHYDARGNIWIGTRYSGLVQLYRDSLTSKYATHLFNRSDGLISDFIRSITSDNEGNIWIGTHAGIEKLIPTPNGYRIFSFSRVHNFFANIVKLVAGPDKSIWCITASGVVRIKDSRYETTPPSEVYITSVSTDKQNLFDPQYQLPFDLKYNQNFMGIEFSSNDHINGRQLKYSYRLNGSQDTSWSKPIPIHKVSFANLLPNNYSFEVRALGWDGKLGKTTFYKFKIRPPFWQQTWFVLLSIAAILAILYSFYRYRIRQLNRIQEVRNRIASDLHDEIGSSLTHVNILSEIGKKTSGSESQPLQLFNRIGEEVQTSAEALDDIIWSVSSRADTTGDLISRMRRYASELFDAKGISFSFHEDHFDESKTIDLELRRDLYLIYKELLRNIIRHSQANVAEIKISGEHNYLQLLISDNGHGFNPDAPSDRQGLHSLRGRVAKWKGKMTIDSSLKKGTVIKVGLPLKPARFLNT
jgi:ligand-binding sensor domain-containing protein/signal transduction histidine kinase